MSQCGAAALAAFALAGCADESVSGYAAEGPWRLTEIEGQSVSTPATVSLLAAGRVAGTLPCNSFSARQTAPYPWFALDDLRVGRDTCDALDEKRRIVAALASATLVEVQGPVLILSDENGTTLVFRLD